MNNICQNCKKARATYHLTEIDPENNQPHELHLCENCAREMGTSQKPAKSTQAMTFTTSLINLQDKPGKPKATGSKLVCPDCGMTYQEFRVKGRFGCLGCYDVFEESLVSLLERVHGASQYVGPHPGGVTDTVRSSAALEQELIDLRRRLNRVVKDEDYEEAARIRDRIEEVERTLTESRNG